MAEDQSSDPRFVVFIAPEWGIRAIARILLNDFKAGIDTIRGLISRWAPPEENDTDAYVKAVEKVTGHDEHEEIDVRALLPKLIEAIIIHENGKNPYSDWIIEKGIELERAA